MQRAEADEARHRSALADTIEANRAEILRRWLSRVQRRIGERAIGSSQLKDSIPDYLSQLSIALRSGDELGKAGETAWDEIAHEHAVTRVRLGFDVDQVVTEFFDLRKVLLEVAKESGAVASGGAEPLTALLEGAVTTAVRSYVQARDYQSRKVEAEHIGFITHELRNPLSVAILALSRLRHLVGQAPETVKVLDIAESALGRLAGLIDRVLLVERHEAQGTDVHAVDVEVGELLDQALHGARAEAESKNITLAVTGGSAEAAVLHVDRKLAVSALQNIVDNAVKYTDQGRVEVHLEDRPGQVEIEVRDNCDGLSPEELRTIFLPFKRGHSGKPGTGLGLAIARQAAEANGGTIRAESAGERGCLFSLTLPKATH